MTWQLINETNYVNNQHGLYMYICTLLLQNFFISVRRQRKKRNVLCVLWKILRIEGKTKNVDINN